MNADQGLILALYAGFAGILLLVGYIYKVVRDNRKQRDTPKFNFPTHAEDVHEDHFEPTHTH